ncbi:hypothetical protein D3C81_1538770 [compost metagenome]
MLAKHRQPEPTPIPASLQQALPPNAYSVLPIHGSDVCIPHKQIADVDKEKSDLPASANAWCPNSSCPDNGGHDEAESSSRTS